MLYWLGNGQEFLSALGVTLVCHACNVSLVPEGLGGKRGAGVPGYGVPGSKCKHGGTIISPNNEVEILLFQIAMKINRRETRFLVIKAN